MGFVRWLLRLPLLFVLFLVGAIWVGVASILPGEHSKHGSWSMRAYRTWSRVFLFVLGVKVVVSGCEVKRGTFLVANHVSWLDILLTAAVFPVRFVSKSEVARWPIIGFVARRLGTVFHDRGAQGAATSTSDKMVQVLQAGKSIMVFPEGTTTPGITVRPFHARLYQAAIAAECDVQAVAINYRSSVSNPCSVVPYVNGCMLIKNLFKVMSLRDVVADVVVCEPVTNTDAPRKHLSKQTHAQVSLALTNLRQINTASEPEPPCQRASLPKS